MTDEVKFTALGLPPLPLSKREWFAGMALQGLLSSSPAAATMNPDIISQGAYIFADAMIKGSAK